MRALREAMADPVSLIRSRAHRLPRHLRVRRAGARAPRRLAPSPGARHHPARPPPRPRTHARRAAGRRRRARARARARPARGRERRRRPRRGSPRSGPEAVIVCAFGALIREPLLSAHPMLNVHPSLLPRWRGAAPVERAIMAGDARTGVSIMALTAGLDSGPVFAVGEEPIAAEDTYGTLAPRLAELRRRAAGRRARPLAGRRADPQAEVGHDVRREDHRRGSPARSGRAARPSSSGWCARSPRTSGRSPSCPAGSGSGCSRPGPRPDGPAAGHRRRARRPRRCSARPLAGSSC